MARDFPYKVRFKAVDKLSKAVDKIKNKFPALTRNVTRSNNAFRILQSRTEKLRRSLNKIGSGLKNAGKSMTAGLTVPLAALGGLAFKANEEFQEAFNKVEAKAKVQGKTFQDLSNLARELGKTTQFSATQAADAMAFLAQAGFKTNEIYAATPAILDLAAASGEDLAMTADVLSNVMGAFNLEKDFKSSKKAADIFAATLAGSNVNLTQFADTMKFVAPVANQFGASLEETSAAVGFLGNIGIQGSNAATALKTAFLNLSAPTSTASKLLERLGISVANEKGEMKSIIDIFQELAKRMKDFPQQSRMKILNELFGKRGIAGASELMAKTIQGNNNALEKFAKELENSDGAAQRMAKTMMKGLPGATKRMKSAFEGMLLTIGFEGGLNGVFESFLNKLASLFQWFSKLNPTVLKVLLVFGAILAVLGPLTILFGTLIGSLAAAVVGWNAITAAMVAAEVTFGGLALSATIIAAKFIIISTLIAILVKNFDELKETLMRVFTEPLSLLKDFVNMIMGLPALFKKVGAFEGFKTLFGFGEDESDLDKKLKEKGFTIKRDSGEDVQPGALGMQTNAQPEGQSLDTKRVTQKMNPEFVERTNNARVNVTFKNTPPGTKILSESENNALDINRGMAGAF